MATAPVIKSGILCPGCRISGSKVHLLAKLGEGFVCEAGLHKYNDTEQLRMMNPELVKLPPPPPKIQEGRVSMQISVPTTLRDALTSKFGVKLEPSVTAILSCLLEPDAYVVSGVDQQRISQLAGKIVRNSIELYSAFYEKNYIYEEMKKEVEKYKAIGSSRQVAEDPSAVKVSIPTDVVDDVKSKAGFNNMAIGDYIATVLQFAVKNGWV
jgi:hypothetical protein